MESRSILITLGVLAGLTILFQGASSVTSVEVSRGGGECNQAKDCCGAQNCHVINCNNSQQFNLIVIKGVNAAGCAEIADNLKAAVASLIADVTDLLNAGPCGETILNSITAAVGASSKNVQCCNNEVNNGGIGGLLPRGDSSNCNNITNKCTAACGHQGSRIDFRGDSVVNECKSDCCSIKTC